VNVNTGISYFLWYFLATENKEFLIFGNLRMAAENYCSFFVIFLWTKTTENKLFSTTKAYFLLHLSAKNFLVSYCAYNDYSSLYDVHEFNFPSLA
jgi:hypothetical protein